MSSSVVVDTAAPDALGAARWYGLLAVDLVDDPWNRGDDLRGEGSVGVIGAVVPLTVRSHLLNIPLNCGERGGQREETTRSGVLTLQKLRAVVLVPEKMAGKLCRLGGRYEGLVGRGKRGGG